MDRILTYAIIIVVLFSGHKTYAQTNDPKGKMKVVAVKGNVYFNTKLLAKNDIFEFAQGIRVIQQLKFSSPADWIKLMAVDSKKIFNYYHQKKLDFTGFLGTKDGGTYINNDIDLLKYFERRCIFLYEPDTLICHGVTIKTNNEIVPVFQVISNNEVNNVVVGCNDTIIISHDNLFHFLKGDQYLIASFLTDSIRLIYYKITNPQKQIIPVLPYFKIIFIEDVVQYLKTMELKEDEIYIEIVSTYLNHPDTLKKDYSEHLKKVDTLLKKKIHQILTE